MVWFHGGGYWYGSAGAPLYDGGNLARSGDVVVVGVNHRLNAFGYMWLGDIVPELADEGNVGQQDLVAALRWVRENIANFGGDPQNVTIFGESGGGGKVSSLLATPSAVGLFHRAIVQSGSAARLQSKEEASETARLTLAALGPGPFDLKRLQSVKAEQLKAAAAALAGQYLPVLDGSFMTHQTWATGAPPESSGIPMMIGYNTHEMVAFQPDFADPISDDAELERRFRAVELVPVLSSEQYHTFLDGYRAMSSDPVFMRLAKEQADIKAAQGARDVYVYEFTWRTPCFGGQWAVHGSELPLEFGNLSYAPAWDGKDSDALRAAADPQGHQARLSAEMITAWSSFARAGDPSTASLPWPAYDANTGTVMVLAGAESKAVPRYADQRYALVRDLPVRVII
jgi:para-nitrobenzyl esterase